MMRLSPAGSPLPQISNTTLGENEEKTYFYLYRCLFALSSAITLTFLQGFLIIRNHPNVSPRISYAWTWCLFVLSSAIILTFLQGFIIIRNQPNFSPRISYAWTCFLGFAATLLVGRYSYYTEVLFEEHMTENT